MRIGSLFSGIGGLELGLERAGVGPVVWQVEIDPFCREVLAHHWPDAERFGDIRELTGRELAPVDLICGGFPCQDVSSAGTRKGLEGERSGLWAEFRRIVDMVRPRFVVLENVSALLVRGLGTVLGDLASFGYCIAWDCIPAEAVGAPHRRDRIFLVAWLVPDPNGRAIRDEPERREGPPQAANKRNPFATALGETLADGDGRRLESERFEGVPRNSGEQRKQRDKPHGRDVEKREFPPPPYDLQSWFDVPVGSKPAVCLLADGLPPGVLRERTRQLKALGNSVVPKCGEVVGRVVRKIEEGHFDQERIG